MVIRHGTVNYWATSRNRFQVGDVSTPETVFLPLRIVFVHLPDALLLVAALLWQIGLASQHLVAGDHLGVVQLPVIPFSLQAPEGSQQHINRLIQLGIALVMGRLTDVVLD
jgi:hypothetical protein